MANNKEREMIARSLLRNLNNTIQVAKELDIPVVFDDEQEENIVFYFNEEYGKIFVDKSFIVRKDVEECQKK